MALAMTAFSDAALITFKGGFVAKWLVVRRLLAIETRGATFVLLADGRFRVEPPSVLTPDDRVFLRDHRDEARQCVAYVERILQEPV